MQPSPMHNGHLALYPPSALTSLNTTPAQSSPQPQHTALHPHVQSSPSGQLYIGNPPQDRQLDQGARVPVVKVESAAGIRREPEPGETLWLVCKKGGFKVEAVKDGHEASPIIVVRDTVKVVREVLVKVDSSSTAGSIASVVITCAPSTLEGPPRIYHHTLSSAHPSYDYLEFETLKRVLRAWQQEDESIKAVIASQLSLSPADPVVPPKPEGYDPLTSTTWVSPFPPVPRTATTSTLDGQPPTKRAKPSKPRAPSIEPYTPPPPRPEEPQPRESDTEPIFWNDTGRQRRKTTLKVRSYAMDGWPEGEKKKLAMEGGAGGAGGESTSEGEVPMAIPRPASAGGDVHVGEPAVGAQAAAAAAAGGGVKGKAKDEAERTTPTPTPQLHLSALPPLPPSSTLNGSSTSTATSSHHHSTTTNPALTALTTQLQTLHTYVSRMGHVLATFPNPQETKRELEELRGRYEGLEGRLRKEEGRRKGLEGEVERLRKVLEGEEGEDGPR
ncbi:hypothetical protein JCM11641_001329 [Rhodosporidiobolus odoratus]